MIVSGTDLSGWRPSSDGLQYVLPTHEKNLFDRSFTRVYLLPSREQEEKKKELKNWKIWLNISEYGWVKSTRNAITPWEQTCKLMFSSKDWTGLNGIQWDCKGCNLLVKYTRKIIGKCSGHYQVSLWLILLTGNLIKPRIIFKK